MLDGLLTGELDASWDAILHLILPAIALGSIPLAIVVRMTRASVLDVLHEDYVRTAKAKGLSPGLISRRHVLRNALLPVTTTIGLQTGALLSGAVLPRRRSPSTASARICSRRSRTWTSPCCRGSSCSSRWSMPW